jgi:murein DD-endopeptidase MepM/ murein hydrolase activator NlpD
LRLSVQGVGVCAAVGLTVTLLSIQFASSPAPPASAATGPEFVTAYPDLTTSLPATTPDAAAPALVTISFQVQRGDTLATLLSTAGVERRQADAAIHAIRAVFNPKHLNIGNDMIVALLEQDDAASRLEGVTLRLGGDNYIEVSRTGDTEYDARRTSDPSLAQEQADLAELLHIGINKGDTLATLLTAAGVSPQQVDLAVRALRQQFNPKKLRTEHEIFLSLDSGAELLGFALKVGDSRFVTVTRDNSGRYVARRTGQPNLPKASMNVVAETTPADTVTPEAPLIVPTPAADVVDNHPASAPSPSQARTVDATRVSAIDPVLQGDGPNATLAIEKGDTLMNALLRAGAGNADAHHAIEAFKQVLNPRKLQVGQELTVQFDREADKDDELVLASFSLQLGPDRDIVVNREGNGRYEAGEIQKPIEMVATRTQGTINSSLYVAAVDAGMPVAVLMEMIRAFSFDVDFQREIQKGNTFEILFDRAYTTDGALVREGPLRYAALTLGGKTLELYRFELADGRIDYFDTKGQSVRKALMRTPIDGARLSSTYGMREHPILGYSTMHRGVDFAASSGTPIMAAGDGVIEKSRRNGGYGKYVRIRHNSSYSTAYAHLNAYGPGIKEGRRVNQGDIIGYVGTTGRSTGPHLHYEVLLDDKQINPLSVKLPTGEKLEGAELTRFEQSREAVIAELNSLPAITQVAEKDAETR